MKVYKFGGASVRNADGVRNLASIVSAENEPIFIIVSAMGKTTTALESTLDSFFEGRRSEALAKLQEIVGFHSGITGELWRDGTFSNRATGFFKELESTLALSDPGTQTYEMWYDRIVGYGELVSTAIVSDYLSFRGMPNRWLDMRECFVTSDRYKDANIDLERSAQRLISIVAAESAPIYVGQGFIGGTEEGVPTTIGREGSDYSAAAAAYILDAQSVTIWKDVEGILNGDPKIFSDARHIPSMNYLDAIELAYSGAQIIHPKTIKPLQNKNIPLHVRCFLDPSLPGSVIKAGVEKNRDIPILILKPAQVLLTIQANDLSFILEERFARIFAILDEFMVKVNLIQSSAVNLDLCMDKTRHLEELVQKLESEGYYIRYNTEMELLTVRGYTAEQLMRFGESPDVYLMQRTRRALQVVRKRE